MILLLCKCDRMGFYQRSDSRENGLMCSLMAENMVWSVASLLLCELAVGVTLLREI